MSSEPPVPPLPAPPGSAPDHRYRPPTDHPTDHPPYVHYPPPNPYHYPPLPLPGQIPYPPYGHQQHYPSAPYGYPPIAHYPPHYPADRNSNVVSDSEYQGTAATSTHTPSAADSSAVDSSISGSGPERRQHGKNACSKASGSKKAKQNEPKKPKLTRTDSKKRDSDMVGSDNPPLKKPKSTTKMRYKCVHFKEDRFFKNRAPRDWSLSQYLEHCESVRGVEARRAVLNRYCGILDNVAHCDVPDCCPPAHRKRAKILRERYKEPGLGSDKIVGRIWCKNSGVSDAVRTDDAGSASANIYLGPTYYGDIKKAINNGPHISLEADKPTTAAGNEAHKDTSAGENEDDSDVCFASSSTSDYEEASLATAFRQSYDALDSDYKWVLKSDRAVEDVIFRKVRKAGDEDTSFETQMARSFVIDVSSSIMKSWFELDEWAEICAAVPPLPEPDVAFIESLVRFENVNTVEELRDVLRYNHYLKDGETYDKRVHWQMEWANNAMRDLCNLYDALNEPLRLNNNAEDWFSTQVWSSIVDKCFWNIEGITVQRKEVTCIASAERKNRHRTSSSLHRYKIGPRLDGVVRTIEDDTYEFAGFEVAKTQKTTTSSKWLSDSLKLSKALRDILRRLQTLVRNDPAVVKKLQVSGILTLGLSMQVLRLSRPRGYVCLLKREEVWKVPSEVGGLREVLHLLKGVAQVKDIVKACVEDVRSRPKEGDLREELLNGRKEDGPALPWAADSPPS